MKHFKLKEFACHCCGKAEMELDFLKLIDQAREIAQMPFIIHSGYRCPKHNKEVGSTSTNHTRGKAADIRCDGPFSRLLIITGLIKAGFRRIIIYPTFIHADTNNGPEGIFTSE